MTSDISSTHATSTVFLTILQSPCQSPGSLPRGGEYTVRSSRDDGAREEPCLPLGTTEQHCRMRWMILARCGCFRDTRRRRTCGSTWPLPARRRLLCRLLRAPVDPVLTHARLVADSGRERGPDQR